MGFLGLVGTKVCFSRGLVVRCPRVMIDNNGVQAVSHARYALGGRARRAAS